MVKSLPAFLLGLRRCPGYLRNLLTVFCYPASLEFVRKAGRLCPPGILPRRGAPTFQSAKANRLRQQTTCRKPSSTTFLRRAAVPCTEGQSTLPQRCGDPGGIPTTVAASTVPPACNGQKWRPLGPDSPSSPHPAVENTFHRPPSLDNQFLLTPGRRLDNR